MSYVSYKCKVTPKKAVGTWSDISHWVSDWGPIGTNAGMLVDADLALNSDGVSVTRTLVYESEDKMNLHLESRPMDLYTDVFDESDIEIKTF